MLRNMELTFILLFFFFLMSKSFIKGFQFLTEEKEKLFPNLQYIMQMRVSFLTNSPFYTDIVGHHWEFSCVQANNKEDFLWHRDFVSSSLPRILPVTWFYLLHTWLVSQRKSNTNSKSRHSRDTDLLLNPLLPSSCILCYGLLEQLLKAFMW